MGAEQKMKKQREKALNTKHEIEEAAKKLIAENGYTKTSISDIVAQSGYSVGAFYGHFKSKEQLAADLYKQIMIQAICESVDKGSAISDEDRFIDFLVAHASKVNEDKVLAAIALRCSISQEYMDEISQYAVRYLAMVKNAINRFNPDMPESEAWNSASIIHCIINSYSESKNKYKFLSMSEDNTKKVIRMIIDSNF